MREKYSGAPGLGLLLVTVLNARFAFASEGFLETLVSPFRAVDLVPFYDANHAWVDFFIFLFIFIPIARFTVGRRFEGRQGTLLSAAIGVVLALSLALMERSIGFSVQSFGPIAAAIIVLLVGLVLFYLVKSFGAGIQAAGSIALILTYFLLRATVPNFFLWLANNQWAVWLHVTLVFAVAIAMWKLFNALWPKDGLRSLGEGLERSHAPDSDVEPRMVSEKQESRLIKQRLEKFTKKGKKESKEIIEDLEEMLRIIDEYGDTDRGRHLIAEKLNHIAPKENSILKRIAYLMRLARNIEQADLRSFEGLKSRLGRLPEKEQELVKEEIRQEKRKIVSEERLRQLQSELQKYDQDFRYCIRMAVGTLSAGQPLQARDWIQKAIGFEQHAADLFAEMQELEEKLLSLTNKEYKAFKKEKEFAKEG
jgi:hypothetical protein